MFEDIIQASWLTPLASGFGLTAGLIVAIGAQNAYILKQGLRRMHVAPLVITCALYDAILVSVGLAGMGSAIAGHPLLLHGVRYVGAAVLTLYGARAWYAARRGQYAIEEMGTAEPVATAESVRPERPSNERCQVSQISPILPVPAQRTFVTATALGTTGYGPVRTLGKPVAVNRDSLMRSLLTVTAFTWLNPHVYLDTVVLLGGIGGQLPWVPRLWFGAGAIGASCVWFALLGFGASRLSGYFKTAAAWRWLDAVIGIVMFAMAGSLLAGVLG